MEITWNISAMDCLPSADGYSDVVQTVHWSCSGVDEGYTGYVYSTCQLPFITDDQFIPYNELTQQTVLDWIWANGVDKTATEATVSQQIETAKNPPVITPALPW